MDTSPQHAPVPEQTTHLMTSYKPCSTEHSAYDPTWTGSVFRPNSQAGPTRTGGDCGGWHRTMQPLRSSSPQPLLLGYQPKGDQPVPSPEMRPCTLPLTCSEVPLRGKPWESCVHHPLSTGGLPQLEGSCGLAEKEANCLNLSCRAR